MIIAMDVDGVVADLHPEWMFRFRVRTGFHLAPKDITDWNIGNLVPEYLRGALYDVLREPDIYTNVAPVPGAIAGIAALHSLGHRVVFVTSCPRGTAEMKREWLIEHRLLPATHTQTDFIVASDKSLIRADVLVDDALHNVEAFPGLSILMDAPYNQGVNHPRRAQSWGDIMWHVGALTPVLT